MFVFSGTVCCDTGVCNLYKVGNRLFRSDIKNIVRIWRGHSAVIGCREASLIHPLCFCDILNVWCNWKKIFTPNSTVSSQGHLWARPFLSTTTARSEALYLRAIPLSPLLSLLKQGRAAEPITRAGLIFRKVDYTVFIEGLQKYEMVTHLSLSSLFSCKCWFKLRAVACFVTPPVAMPTDQPWHRILARLNLAYLVLLFP